jgi:hypothetical protein
VIGGATIGMSKPEYKIGQSLFYRKGRGQGRYIVLGQCFGNRVAAFATELEIRMTNRLNTLHSKLNSAPNRRIGIHGSTQAARRGRSATCASWARSASECASLACPFGRDG